ncbi:MAG: hypothetical protein H8E47_12210 [Anaerolineales bacterium]|nr:hypothetical protein [Anaerolineales bacterium]
MTKRGIFGTVLLIISLSTLTVFLISNFIQPILPSSVNSALVIFVVSLVGVLGALAALNDIVELFQKILGSQRDLQQSNAGISEHSLTIYPHRNPPYNAAKVLYTGPEIAKDLVVKIVYQDSAGDPQTKVVTDFFPKEDPRMWKHHYKYDFLEPNQVVYFHLLKKKSTSDGKATVIAAFTGATSGKSVKVEREFDLEEF